MQADGARPLRRHHTPPVGDSPGGGGGGAIHNVDMPATVMMRLRRCPND